MYLLKLLVLPAIHSELPDKAWHIALPVLPLMLQRSLAFELVMNNTSMIVLLGSSACLELKTAKSAILDMTATDVILGFIMTKQRQGCEYLEA
jgi:multisubunit Na+/H+ antiporter MnhF subunit